MSGVVERVVKDVVEVAVDVAKDVGKAAKDATETAKRTLAHDAETMDGAESSLAHQVPDGNAGPATHPAAQSQRGHGPALPPLRERLDQAAVWKGNLPAKGGPANGILLKRAPDGTITNYTVYDNLGNAVKRVDLTGDAHNLIPTPHTMFYRHDRAPDGTVHPHRTNDVRPATPDEIP